MTDLAVADAVERIQAAASSGRLSESSVENLRRWIEQPAYAEYLPTLLEHVDQEKWKELDDAFWTIIPFGTGGRRGRMYPIGTNAINDRTIGESIQGLVDYVQAVAESGAPLSCAVAYDTRHRSREFAELASGILAAAGFRVYFLDGYRSTPELSFAVRHKACSCGVMVTASHNPPSDNAVKVYWSTGGQLLPPHDRGVIDRVMQVGDIACKPFEQAVSDGDVVFCQEEVDAAFLANVAAQSLGGPRDLRVVFSPLHGVGTSAVAPSLEKTGFADVEIFGPHAEPSGDFPNVPGHVSNPENPAVFDAIIARCQEAGADLALATDPDCDRLGAAAPRGGDPSGEWGTFTGNQIGALLTEFVLERRKASGTLTPEHYLAKTLVTTEMIRRIGDAYGVRTEGNLLVGFKWDRRADRRTWSRKFVLGTEESHGYQVGTYTRDKDGAVAAVLLCEAAAACKAADKACNNSSTRSFGQFGVHAERTVSVTLPGAEGMQQMKAVMQSLRTSPPASLAGLSVAGVRDYLNQQVTIDGAAEPLDGPQGDLVILDLAEEGNYAAVRPSGNRAEDQVLPLHLHAGRADRRLRGLEVPNLPRGSTPWSPIFAPRRASLDVARRVRRRTTKTGR